MEDAGSNANLAMVAPAPDADEVVVLEVLHCTVRKELVFNLLLGPAGAMVTTEIDLAAGAHLVARGGAHDRIAMFLQHL